jgi:TolB-like protein
MATSLAEDRALLTEESLWEAQRISTLVPHYVRSSSSDSFQNPSEDRRAADGRYQSRESDMHKGTNALNEFSLSNEAVQQQLTRILRSKAFIQSGKLSRFLRFVVEHVLDGNPGCLKEYLIGVEVYDRKPPYDPSQDSIVRTEARRLRGKLKDYYETEGKEDPVYVYLRPGSYIPVFHSSGDLAGPPSAGGPDLARPLDASLVMTAILPFKDVSENSTSSIYARGIADELAYALMLAEGCTVISPCSTAHSSDQVVDTVSTMKRVGAQIAFEGSVRVEGSQLRVTARIVNATGSQLWVKRIDTEIGKQPPFAVEEQIAFALSAGFHIVRKLSAEISPLPGDTRH